MMIWTFHSFWLICWTIFIGFFNFAVIIMYTWPLGSTIFNTWPNATCNLFFRIFYLCSQAKWVYGFLFLFFPNFFKGFTSLINKFGISILFHSFEIFCVKWWLFIESLEIFVFKTAWVLWQMSVMLQTTFPQLIWAAAEFDNFLDHSICFSLSPKP